MTGFTLNGLAQWGTFIVSAMADAGNFSNVGQAFQPDLRWPEGSRADSGSESIDES